MAVFTIHEQLIADYRAFTCGFVQVRDPRFRAHVARELAEGAQIFRVERDQCDAERPPLTLRARTSGPPWRWPAAAGGVPRSHCTTTR